MRMRHLIQIVSIVVVCIAVALYLKPRSSRYREFTSPDNQYLIVVNRQPEAFTMPGQSSDAPGTVVLMRKVDGLELRRAKVEMVQMIDRVEWHPNHVNIGLFAVWPLPSEGEGQL